jgi:hypothetical protein
MRSIASVVLVWMWLSPTLAQAQLPDLVSVTAQYMPPAELESRRPAKAQVFSYDASLNAPVLLGSRTFLIPGLTYHFDSVSYSDTPPAFTELRAFHSLEIPLLVVQLLPNDWALSFRVAPALAGDFRGFDAGLFHLSALALGTHSFSKQFALGGGPIVTYAFGSLLFLPAVSAEWKPLDELQILVFVPALVSAKYTFSRRVELGVRADITGNSYSIRDSRVSDRWPCVPHAVDDTGTAANEALAAPAECIDHVAYSVGAVGAVVGVRLFASVWWTTFAGTTFFRRLDQQNDQDGPVTGGRQTLPNVFVVRSALAWRIPIDSAAPSSSSDRPAPE